MCLVGNARLKCSPLLSVATPADYDALGQVMFAAVRTGASGYTQAQRKAWVPHPCTGHVWHQRLAAQYIVMAQMGDDCVGFMNLAPKGYIDFAYIHPNAQGSGLFRKLYAEIEKQARSTHQTRLWVHASLMAQPAFTAMGFAVSREESVKIGSESFERSEMEKRLPA